jgi:hypothetical protein
MTTIGRAGVSRVSWDLRGNTPRQPELRALAPDNPGIWEEPRFKDRSTRGVFHWGIEGPQRAGVLAAPGSYTVRMTANGRTYSQPFVVIKDPAVTSADSDLVANTETQQRIVSDINSAVGMINQIEVVRKQIEDQLRKPGVTSAQKSALQQLDQKAFATELQLLSRTELNSDDKWFVESYKIYLNLVWLYGEVGTGAGDVAGGADYRPTDAQLETLAQIERDLAKAAADYKLLMETHVPAFTKATGITLILVM